mmetsp:Transcript_21983/g.54400  ORF Transcript_21983/g.54400 Transcript_21983/m.54400 type:complete len:141 (+) Transcript_21983:89-511(+)
MTMIVPNTDSSSSKTQNGRRITDANRHEITILPYAPDTDVRIMDNFYAHSLESSLYSLSIEDHSMPSRERNNSFDSFASSSSAFSLAPRTSRPNDSRRFVPVAEKKAFPKGIIVHPPTKGRAVVEFVFDELPDELMVPVL